MTLTDTQQAIVYEASYGRTNTEIADRLGITLEQVKGQLKQARKRTGAKNKTHLVALAFEHQILR